MELTVKIEQDDCGESPRKWDNMGIMLYGHRRYTLGDIEVSSESEAREWIEENDVLLELPLYLYDHSGITMSTRSFYGRVPQGHARFDSSQVGIIVATREKVLEAGLDPDDLERIEKVLKGEVRTFDTYIRGDVYQISVWDDDLIVDSLCGLYGHTYAEEEGARMLEACKELVKH